MYLISHRGNISGIQKDDENKPEYINKALEKGYDVEIDVRFSKGKFFLGHDYDQYEIDQKFISNEKIWCHAKTSEALLALYETNAHYFWHQEDDYTLTSKGFIWVYPGKPLIKDSIAVLPEKFKQDISICYGICTDNINKYLKDL